MSEPAMPAFHSIQVGFARARQVIGWAGLAGLAMMAAAVLVVALAWMGWPSATIVSDPLVETVLQPSFASKSAVVPVPELPLLLAKPPEVPKLLRQLEQIAVKNGLGWPAADYRVTPAAATHTASLEVRSTLKGPYPQLRASVAQILREVPASTLREFSLNRSSSESVDVEAKLVIAVALDDEPAAAGQIQGGTAR